MGVCAAITPYNFPLTLLGTKVAPALASGNTVVAKPAATTPLATLEVARLFAEAGVPDGVLNVVTGRGSEIGDALVGHPDVRRVAFTGSTEVGRHVVVDRRPAAQARHARARRLGPGDRLRGRRRRRRRQGGDHRPLLERRPGLPRLQARVRARLGLRRLRLAARASAWSATSRATARSRPRSRGCGWARSTPARAATSCSSRSRTASPRAASSSPAAAPAATTRAGSSSRR